MRSTASRRARNSASLRMGGRRRPASRPSLRRCRLASSRVDPVMPWISPLSRPLPALSLGAPARARRCWAGRRASRRCRRRSRTCGDGDGDGDGWPPRSPSVSSSPSVLVGIVAGIGLVTGLGRRPGPSRTRRRSAHRAHGRVPVGPAGGAGRPDVRPARRRSRPVRRRPRRRPRRRRTSTRRAAGRRTAADSRRVRAVWLAVSRISRDSGSEPSSATTAGSSGSAAARHAPGRLRLVDRGVCTARPTVQFGQCVDDALAGGAQQARQRMDSQPSGRPLRCSVSSDRSWVGASSATYSPQAPGRVVLTRPREGFRYGPG